ncbi:MAG TPA: hypothetical protein VGQ73_10015 [Gemmatimonadales bacterium]|jgi:hypothetical protein|nr:hypothetical protein [Gemmatimonadales bacterium]
MKVPWIIHAGAAAQVLPVAAAGVWRRRLSAPRRWILGWCGFLMATTLVVLWLARHNRNNHWLTYLSTPIAGGIALWSLSLWQTSAVAKLAFRLLVPLLGVTWAALLLIENTKTFSLVAEPFAGLLVLGGAIYTLVTNTFRETGTLHQFDWLWIGLGLALYSGLGVALPPTAHWLLARHPELVVSAYKVRAWFEIAAFLAIARGMTCPIAATQSGGSFSPASSRLRSPLPVSSSRS